MKRITVLLADDQTIIRDGLRALLETNPDIQVVAEAKTAAEAYDRRAVHRHRSFSWIFGCEMGGGTTA